MNILVEFLVPCALVCSYYFLTFSSPPSSLLKTIALDRLYRTTGPPVFHLTYEIMDKNLPLENHIQALIRKYFCYTKYLIKGTLEKLKKKSCLCDVILMATF